VLASGLISGYHDSFPLSASYVQDSGRSVAQALQSNRWVRDIKGGVSTAALAQYLRLWDLLQMVQLNHDEDDNLIWCHSKDG
jgi:hypothetical protein